MKTELSDFYRVKPNPEIFQSSISPKEYRQSSIIPQTNGLVDTLVMAYNHHHKVIIRPDDVWIAILSQFNVYVNAHSEELRQHFVAHEGKKELIVFLQGNRYTVDFGFMARLFSEEISKNVVDKTLTDWILPSFTTTTEIDTVVSAVLMMATLQSYFSYTGVLLCGLPLVTLEGEKQDWIKLVEKLDKFEQFGEEPALFARNLRPILNRFVAAFDDPDGQDNRKFWSRIYSHERYGSGSSRWITAFSFWDKKGRKQYSPPDKKDSACLVLDGVRYGYLDSTAVTKSYASVPVKLMDNGLEIETTMVSGLVGTKATVDTVSPLPGWWIFEGSIDKWKEAEAAENDKGL
ncbi:hypothetical protein BT69DRAFT_1308292 [Atractiella rhizophila]|nr:hypothetical protein BT69DRAFT_1308292 [Atractiella rhizophila]